MAEDFKLPGSSFDELFKIIRAYASGKIGNPMSLDSLAQTTGMDKTVISRNNGFLVQIGLISDGVKKSPTQICIDLERSYTYKQNEQSIRLWRGIIDNDEFLTRMISAIKIRNGMERASLINHILYSSGSANTNNTRTGANTIIEIFRSADYVVESDGKIVCNEIEQDVERNINESINASSDAKLLISAQPTVISGNASKSTCVSININVNVTADQFSELAGIIKNFLNELNK